jgi:DnaA family protein
LEKALKHNAQLALSVQLPDDETFSSYQGSTNQTAVAQLQKFIETAAAKEDGPHGFYLFGVSGVGKSHLLHASCAHASELGLSSLCLSFSELKELTVDVFDGLENIDLICLDDLHLIAGDEDWQQAVFDLFNRLTEQNKSLLISGDQSASQLGITLPDLVSRLSWGLTEQVKILTDDEKLIALQFRAQQRGLLLTDEVGRFFLSRLSRGMGSLLQALDELDKASIREQRKITIPFIKEILL